MSEGSAPAAASALRRIGVLLRARLASGPRGGLPIAALLAQTLITTTFCALVRDGLPPFAYGIFAMTLTAALLALPLLGELGWLLRRDEAEAWIASLPAEARDRNFARLLHLLILLGGLALASLIPAAVLAPSTTELLGRLLLPLLGLGLAALLAALLLLVQSALGERAEAMLVIFQTAVVVGTVGGLVSGLRAVPTLARIPTIGDAHAPFLWLFPPAWFAAPLAAAEGEPARWWLPALAGVVALVILVKTPAPAPMRRTAGPSWLALLLVPFRWVATRFWVRRDERAMFDLVYDALPREREVVLRTVPMIGIPLAFLLVAASGADSGSGGRGDILALLLFTVGIYLPILLVHVPATETPGAVWLQETAPVPAGAVTSGAIKALAVRFLLPLYALLLFLAWVQGGPTFVLRLALPGLGVSLLTLRCLYPVCVHDAPLSTAPADVRFDLDWIGVLGMLALVLTLAAVLANRFLTPTGGVVAATLLFAGEFLAGWSLRRKDALGPLEGAPEARRAP